MDREVLIANGWESMIGYCFKTPPADEHDFTFVEKSHAEKVFEKGPVEYFLDPNRDALFDLESAWDYFLDDWYDKYDVEYPLKEVRE